MRSAARAGSTGRRASRRCATSSLFSATRATRLSTIARSSRCCTRSARASRPSTATSSSSVRSLARSSFGSTLVMRKRRHAGAASVSTAPSGRPPGRALDGDRSQVDVGLAQLHRGRQSSQRDGGEVGALGVALDELERRHAHGRAGLGDRRLVASQREVGLQHTLDDAGHRVLDPDAVLLAHADQQARHADLDARRRTRRRWRIAVEAHAAIDERLAHAERELLAAEIGERAEPDHVARPAARSPCRRCGCGSMKRAMPSWRG